LKIKVKPLFNIKKIMGNKAVIEIEMEEDATVIGLLAELSNTYGEDFRKEALDPKTQGIKLKHYYIIMVNGRHYLDLADRLDTRLREGDLVVICPAFGGG
jgi:molybdopterin converting factor small subunit